MPLRQEYECDPTKRTRGEYVIGSTVIGKGATSIVKLAVHSPTKQTVAAKIVNLFRYGQYYEREVQALSKLDHSHIVKLLHIETHQEEGYGVLFLEYLPFPSLYEHVRNVGQLPEPVGIQVLAQIVDGFKYMQNLGFSHRDFKPENVTYDSSTGMVKILDFGLTLLNTTGETQFLGSPLYMAPEVLLHQPHDPFLADVWSIGICFYEILTGDTPFHECVDKDDLLDQLLYEDPFYSIPSYLSPNTTYLLQRMLVCDPSARITIDGLVEVLGKFLKFGEDRVL